MHFSAALHLIAHDSLNNEPLENIESQHKKMAIDAQIATATNQLPSGIENIQPNLEKSISLREYRLHLDPAVVHKKLEQAAKRAFAPPFALPLAPPLAPPFALPLAPQSRAAYRSICSPVFREMWQKTT